MAGKRRPQDAARWPLVSIVWLVYNRREKLRESLGRMLRESDYAPDRLEAIVVDNASSDGSARMVREEFPAVRLVELDRNVGVSGWNPGLAEARGDYLLMLDDDCYLPPDGLRRAVEAARENDADLVSFKVASADDPGHVFTEFVPGLFSFWGCAVLLRREVYEAIGGYDPDIFVWANELEYMLRFFDRGFRHLYLPDVVALHMKPPRPAERNWRNYRYNARHFVYIAAKLLRRRDAVAVVTARLTRIALDALAISPRALRAYPGALAGLVRGLRRREPLQRPEVSRAYRDNFESFASPWLLAEPLGRLIRALPAELAGRPVRGKRRRLLSARRDEYFAARAHWYPDEPGMLTFAGPESTASVARR
jgi:GT2 family glycosyltransferase